MPKAAREAMSGGSKQAGVIAMSRSPDPEIVSGEGEAKQSESEIASGTTSPRNNIEPDDEQILWEEDALWEVEKIEAPSVKEQVRLRTEKRVRIMGRRYVTRGDIV